MPYLGQSPSKGDENNFKILDDISSYTLTFDGSDSSVVSAANDTITTLNHRFITGQRVTYNKGGGTVITGLSDGVYYIIKEDHHTIKLATSASNAISGTAVNITGVGAGASHTLNVAFDGVNTKFKATHNNGTKANITRAAQLVISINGVIQQPHDSTAPSTGFGFDLDGVIVLSQAPAASDIFWSHVLTNNNVTFDISDNTIDNFTGNGSTTTFNLSKSPANNDNILVTIDGVVQYPDDNTNTRAYTVVENVLTFTSAPASGTEIQVRHIGFAGSTSAPLTGFYGRTGNAVLKSTDNITVNDAAITGNATISGNLTVDGTTTTLDTTLMDVDRIEVLDNSTNVAVAITQSGTGDILNLYDGSSEVFSVTDGGNIIAGVGDLATHTGSRRRLVITDTGNGALLHIRGQSPALFFDQSGGNIGKIYQDNADLGIYAGRPDSEGANTVRITSAGKVGINKSDPDALLHIHNSGTSVLPFKAYRNDVGDVPVVHFQAYSNTVGVVDKFVVTARGRVGVNTDNPQRELHVKPSDNNPATAVPGYIRIDSQGSNQPAVLELYHTRGNAADKWPSSVASVDGGLSLNTANGNNGAPQEKVRINQNGLGIHTSNPLSGLHISDGTAYGSTQNSNRKATLTISAGSEGSSDIQLLSAHYNHIFFGDSTDPNTGIIWYQHTGSGTDSMHFSTAGTERLTITSTGKLGIGVNATNPSFQLQIHESVNTAYAANATVAQLAVGNVNSSSATNAAGIHLFTDGNGRGVVNLSALNNSTSSSADFVIQTRHSATLAEKFRINSTGQIITNGSANPFPTRGLTLRPNSGQTHNYLSIIAGNTSSVSGVTFGTSPDNNGNNYRAMFEYYHSGFAHNEGLRFLSAGTEALRIRGGTAAGDILYGPGDHVVGASPGLINAQGSHNNANVASVLYGIDDGGGYNGMKVINFDDGTYNSQRIEFLTGKGGYSMATVRMGIDENGLVSIGRTISANSSFNSSTNQLVVGNGVGNQGMVVYTGASHAGSLIFNDVADGTFQGGLSYKHGSGSDDNSLKFYANADERLRITKDGRVGINETTVDTQLHISGNANAQTTPGSGTNAIRITDTDTSAQSGQVYGEIQFETRDATSAGVAAFITAQGNANGQSTLKFGTGSGGSASTKMVLHQTGNASLGYQETVPNEYSNQTTFTINGNTYGRLDLEVAGALRGSVWANSGGLGLDAGAYDMEFFTGSGQRLKIETNGQLTTDTIGTIFADINSSNSNGAYCNFDIGANGANIGYLGSANHLVSGGANTDLAIRATNDFRLSTGGSSMRLYIQSTGQLTHSTSATVTTFNTSASNGAYLHLNYGASGALTGYLGAGSHLISGSGVNDFGIRSANHFDISTGGSSRRLSIRSGGQVNIGGGYTDTNNILSITDGYKGFPSDSVQPEANFILKLSDTNNRWIGIGASSTAGWIQASGPGSSGPTASLAINPAGGYVSIGTNVQDGLLTIGGNSDATSIPSIRLLDGSDTREVSISNQSGDLIMSTHGTDNAAHGSMKIYDSGIIALSTDAGAGNAERLRVDSHGAVRHMGTSAYWQITVIHNGSGSGNWYSGSAPQRIRPNYIDNRTGYAEFLIEFNPSTSYSGWEEPTFVICGGSGGLKTGGTIELNMNRRTNSPNNATFRSYHGQFSWQIYNDGDADATGGQREINRNVEHRSSYWLDPSTQSIDYIHSYHSNYNTNAEPLMNQRSFIKIKMNNSSNTSYGIQGHPFICRFVTYSQGDDNWFAYMQYN